MYWVFDRFLQTYGLDIAFFGPFASFSWVVGYITFAHQGFMISVYLQWVLSLQLLCIGIVWLE